MDTRIISLVIAVITGIIIGIGMCTLAIYTGILSDEAITGGAITQTITDEQAIPIME